MISAIAKASLLHVCSQGKKSADPTESLEALIQEFNERIGADLTDADKILFEQRLAHYRADEENRVVALNNAFRQFQTFMKPKVDDGMVARHEMNAELVARYLDDAGFQKLLFEWVTRELFDGFNAASGD